MTNERGDYLRACMEAFAGQPFAVAVSPQETADFTGVLPENLHSLAMTVCERRNCCAQCGGNRQMSGIARYAGC